MGKKICVYSSSSSKVSKNFFDVAEELGRQIAVNNHTLVYGGINVGLMGITAQAAFSNGGKVIGVIPELIRHKGITNENCEKIVVTKDLRERKAWMENNSDVFIALPGGFGTLEEIAEIITLKQLGYHNKPIILINTNNFYERLIDFFENMFKEDFAKYDFKNLYYITDDLNEVFTYIDQYEPMTMPSKWY